MFFCCRNKKNDVAANLLLVLDMVVDAAIGVYDGEKGRKQKVRVNIAAEPYTWPNERADNIEDTVSYDNLVQVVLRHTVQSDDHIHLVETLAERIAQDCLCENPLRHITVRVEKLEIYDNAIPGAEIRRSNERSCCPVRRVFQRCCPPRRNHP